MDLGKSLAARSSRSHKALGLCPVGCIDCVIKALRLRAVGGRRAEA